MDIKANEEKLICTGCGTQFDVPASQPLNACRICDDPRQYVPPAGQTWTSLSKMRSELKYKNSITPLQFSASDPLKKVSTYAWSICTEPKFGIGQRCIFIQTQAGNVLLDCIAYMDDETLSFIKAKGGIKAIVISHPHFYTTHLRWAHELNCPVVLAREDEEWLSQVDVEGRRKFLQGPSEKVVEGLTVVKVGGHFPGSLVLHWQDGDHGRLMIADSLMTAPSALYHVDRPPGTISYTFMWSIPNMIPLPPPELYKIWQALKPYDFISTHGILPGVDVEDSNVKGWVLESMKIQCRAEGWKEGQADIFAETWP